MTSPFPRHTHVVSSHSVDNANDEQLRGMTGVVTHREGGFVPPVARRKQAIRERRHVEQRRRNILLTAGLVLFLAFFFGLNVSYWRSIEKQQQEERMIIAGRIAGVNNNNNLGPSSDKGKNDNAPGNLRGGSRVTWIDEHSQPFVS